MRYFWILSLALIFLPSSAVLHPSFGEQLQTKHLEIVLKPAASSNETTTRWWPQDRAGNQPGPLFGWVGGHGHHCGQATATHTAPARKEESEVTSA